MQVCVCCLPVLGLFCTLCRSHRHSFERCLLQALVLHSLAELPMEELRSRGSSMARSVRDGKPGECDSSPTSGRLAAAVAALGPEGLRALVAQWLAVQAAAGPESGGRCTAAALPVQDGTIISLLQRDDGAEHEDVLNLSVEIVMAVGMAKPAVSLLAAEQV